MKVDTWGYEIISSKHLVGKCVINGRHNIVKRFRRVTITEFNMQRERERETERQRERDRDRETERDRERERDREIIRMYIYGDE